MTAWMERRNYESIRQMKGSNEPEQGSRSDFLRARQLHQGARELLEPLSDVECPNFPIRTLQAIIIAAVRR